MNYRQHLVTFEEHARSQAVRTEPQPLGGHLHRALIRSIQRFQAGEDGDGTGLIAAATRAGDPVYLAAVRLFVAEEQSHAARLANVLRYAGAAPISGHWTDTVFVLVRRGGGLRLELLTLMLAEVVALRYYRALRDGSGDAYVADVAARILADEKRHVPFHLDRLRQSFARTPLAGRVAAAGGWGVLMLGAVLVVALDHGSALRVLGVTRRRFIIDVLRLFRPMAASVFRQRATAAGQGLRPASGAIHSSGTAAAVRDLTSGSAGTKTATPW
ncbi:ferritin-like domain-containing protein [Actinoplanes sp. NEAU-A12]|uniref:Ferritin-like domain-containing protein n=1 Tax=Actinoplanes sandaracinus TaxID=3045177 RepID=A0ABT6WYY1_9ACTN|nr:ferritin-like domain-containing protein [Actinoplanes sandaracinus]MDI6104810.1 ferritin-like domain-containing protein [Actinoplanes sandaracinus]